MNASQRHSPTIVTLTRRACCLAFGASLGVAACSPLDLASQNAPRLYELTPKSTFDPMPTVAGALAIDIPSARTGLNTARIALRPNPTSLDYYADALWIDVVPNMVRTLVIESFDNSEQIKLAKDDTSIRPDFRLILAVREFQADYQDIKEPPQINIVIQAQLERSPRGGVLANEDFSGIVTAAGTSVPDVVAAFDTALGKVLKRLVVWTGEQMASN